MPFAISSVLRDNSIFYPKKSYLSELPTRIPQSASGEGICSRARFYATVSCRPIHRFWDAVLPTLSNGMLYQRSSCHCQFLREYSWHCTFECLVWYTSTRFFFQNIALRVFLKVFYFVRPRCKKMHYLYERQGHKLFL